MNDISYKNYYSKSNSAILQEIGQFIKNHRLDLNLTQTQVAKQAGISRSTLSLLERGETITLNNFIQVLRIIDQLESLKTFSYQKEISPIEYAKLMKEQRQRASGNIAAEPDNDYKLGW